MFRKLTLITLLAASTASLSGCSSMWSGIGSFSDYMAEKTRWSPTPALRGAKNISTSDIESSDSTLYEAYTPITRDSASNTYNVEIYDTTSSSSPSDSIYDANGDYVDTSPIPCPEGTYLTADDTCMYLEQDDFSADFTQ